MTTIAGEYDEGRQDSGGHQLRSWYSIQQRWLSESLVDSDLPFPGQDSYVMNMMAYLNAASILVFALIDTVYWMKLLDPEEETEMPVRSLNHRHIYPLITCIRRGYNKHLGGELLMVSLKSGFVHLFKYEEDNLSEIGKIGNSAVGDDISVWSMALLRNRPVLATSSNTTLIELVDVSDLNEPRSLGFLACHEHNIPSIDVSDDDQLLISVSIDGTGRIWHIASQTLLYTNVLEGPGVWGWASMFFPIDCVSDASLYDSDVQQQFAQVELPPPEERIRRPYSLTAAVAPPAGIWPLLHGSQSSITARCIESGYNDSVALGRHLAVFCNQMHLFLCNSKMNVLDYYHVCTDDCRRHPTYLFTGRRCRVIILRSIPELSLILFCCSRSTRITMLRVVRLHSCYRLKFAGLLPKHHQASCSIIGMDITYGPRAKTEFDHEDFWTIHLLYANGTLCCFEIQRDLQARSMDLLPVVI